MYTLGSILTVYMLDKYEQTLLDGWEEVYKRAQLTLWILLALKDGNKYMNQIKAFINQHTNGTLLADDKSMYRALRRFNDAQMVDYYNQPNDIGPDLKVYSLTVSGKRITKAFVARNINDIFYKADTKKLILGN